MIRSFALLTFPLLALAAMAGCSGPPHGSGVNPAKRFAQLSPEEVGQLCDFEAAQMGGYSAERACPSLGGASIFRSPPDLMSCIDTWRTFTTDPERGDNFALTCRAIVDDFELIARSHGTCIPEPGYDDAFDRMLDCDPFTNRLGSVDTAP